MPTIPASEIRPGHTLSGLDGYVIEVEEQDGYLSVPTGRYSTALPDDTICITFNTAQGEEAYLLVPGDMPLAVYSATPEWVG